MALNFCPPLCLYSKAQGIRNRWSCFKLTDIRRANVASTQRHHSFLKTVSYLRCPGSSSSSSSTSKPQFAGFAHLSHIRSRNSAPIFWVKINQYLKGPAQIKSFSLFQNSSKRLQLPRSSHLCPMIFQARTFNTKKNKKSAFYYYEVLEISPNANQTQIKSAFYKLSKCHHPDVSLSPESHQVFTEINEAYEVLGNTTKRRMYDQGAYGRHNFKPDEEFYTREYRKGENFRRGERPPPPRGQPDDYDYEEQIRRTYEQLRRANTRNQNLDDFTSQHYSDMRKRQWRARQEQQFHEERQHFSGQSRRQSAMQAYLLGIFSAVFLISVILVHNPYDEDRVSTSRKNESES